jgi:hypothetical protein
VSDTFQQNDFIVSRKCLEITRYKFTVIFVTMEFCGFDQTGYDNQANDKKMQTQTVSSLSSNIYSYAWYMSVHVPY